MRRTLYVVAVMHCIVRFICDFNLFFFQFTPAFALCHLFGPPGPVHIVSKKCDYGDLLIGVDLRNGFGTAGQTKRFYTCTIMQWATNRSIGHYLFCFRSICARLSDKFEQFEPPTHACSMAASAWMVHDPPSVSAQRGSTCICERQPRPSRFFGSHTVLVSIFQLASQLFITLLAIAAGYMVGVLKFFNLAPGEHTYVQAFDQNYLKLQHFYSGKRQQ